MVWANGVANSISEGGIFIRDLKIDVYGKRLASDTLFAIKTKSLTVKFSPIRFIQNTKNYIQGHFLDTCDNTLFNTLLIHCLIIDTWRFILDDFLLT